MAKLFIKWVKDFCWMHQLTWQKLVGIVIGIFVGLVSWVWGFTTCDRVPAIANDYAPLEQQMVAIQENPKLLFTIDCNVNVKDNVTTITLTNSKCELTVKLDQTQNVLETNKKDKSYTFWGAIGISFGNCFVFGVVAGVATWIGLWTLYFLVWLAKQIYGKFQKPKEENDAENNDE